VLFIQRRALRTHPLLPDLAMQRGLFAELTPDEPDCVSHSFLHRLPLCRSTAFRADPELAVRPVLGRALAGLAVDELDETFGEL